MIRESMFYEAPASYRAQNTHLWRGESQSSGDESNWPPALESRLHVAISLVFDKSERDLNNEDSAPQLMSNCGWIYKSSEHS